MKLTDDISAEHDHPGSVLDHICQCMDFCAGDSLAVWLAMIHDGFKLIKPIAMLRLHYIHELREKRLAVILSKIIGTDSYWIQASEFTVYVHLQACEYRQIKRSKKLNCLLRSMPYFFADSFIKLADADSHSKISKMIKES